MDGFTACLPGPVRSGRAETDALWFYPAETDALYFRAAPCASRSS
jgi:hypothetical protein